MASGIVDRKAFGRRLTQAVKELYRSKHRFELALDLPHGTVTPWFGGQSLPNAERLAFLAQALGVTTDWLLFGEDSAGSLADRLDAYLRSRLRAAGVPEFVLDTHLLDPADMLELEVEVLLNDLAEWESSRQTAVRHRVHEEDQPHWERPHVPRVKVRTVEEMRASSEESVRDAGDPDTWVLSNRRVRKP